MNQDPWAEAQRRCRLSDDEIRMAKALGFQPHSLIKNIPSPSQQWKAPVNEWVRSQYERKFGSKPVPPQPAAAVIEFRNPDHPWPDNPEIGELVLRLDEALEFDEDEDDADTCNNRALRRQCLFRWAAQSIAVAMNQLPEISKVAAFGSVAQPLDLAVPRFGRYRGRRIETYHQCNDLDLAVWTADAGHLHALKKALQNGLSIVHDTEYGGVAHHQVDVHIFDAAAGDYRGRLCIFKECPKGKRECLARGCGDQPFLQQFDGYRFKPARFTSEPKVILADKASGFVVRMPVIDTKPARIEYGNWPDEDEEEDEDVPF